MEVRTATVKRYGVYAMFAPEVVLLAMNYIYSGQQEFGLDLERRHWENISLRKRHAWDAPNLVRGDTGERVYGTEYYQNMMLWAIPAAMDKATVPDAGKPGGLVNRIIEAAKTS